MGRKKIKIARITNERQKMVSGHSELVNFKLIEY